MSASCKHSGRPGFLACSDCPRKRNSQPAVNVDTSSVGVDPLRPASWADVVGQAKAVEQLRLLVDASRLAGKRLPHILLAGPPGTGKTSLARVFGQAAGMPVTVASGVTLSRPADVVKVMTGNSEGILFVDEVHRCPTPVLELLYTVLEDGRLDVVVGDRPVSIPVPGWVLAAATTRPGALPRPFADRLVRVDLELLSSDELAHVVVGAAGRCGWRVTAEAARGIGARGRGTPRVALHLAERCVEWASVHGTGLVTASVVVSACGLWGVDEKGLTELDRKVLCVLADAQAPVGLSVLAARVGVDEETVSEACEPELMRLGLLARTPRGRVLAAVS